MLHLKDLRWTLTAMLLALAVAGCGGDDDDDDSGTGNGDNGAPSEGSGGDNGGDTGGNMGGGNSGGNGDGGDNTGDGGGTDNGVAAAGCFNNELARAGTTASLKLRVRDRSAAAQAEGDATAQTITIDRENNGAAMFEGRQASELLQTVTTDLPDTTTSVDTRQYVQFLSEDAQTLDIGSQSSITTDGGTTITSTTTRQPGNLNRLDLQPGDSYEITYVEETTTEIGGATDSTTTDSAEVTRVVTYEGRDEVEVPAGVFDACRFSEEVSRSPDGDAAVIETETTYWIGVGFGLQVRQIATSDEAETDTVALALSINGEPVSQ